ncbi:MAG: hypothetical protein ACLTWR_08505 [Agathobaculum desmolans]|uniref:hypothetical protein n=1 Tax=Agathobaculum desmolans TaxID=39484 RepID=UPI0004E1397F|nr:hypothetical protein [Agathobaculum desmolans]
MQQLKYCLREILDSIGVWERLKTFKLSRRDLTCNLYYERGADVRERLEIFKKSYSLPHYSEVSFGKHSDSDINSKLANNHSWTIENKSKSCAFSVYDKSYELRSRHQISIDENILRLELRFRRFKIANISKSKKWECQLIELGSQVEKLQRKFLHRSYLIHCAPVSLPEHLNRINASRYLEKTKKKLRRIAKKANDCVLLAVVRKNCRIKKSEFIKLLRKLEEIGMCCISSI